MGVKGWNSFLIEEGLIPDPTKRPCCSTSLWDHLNDDDGQQPSTTIIEPSSEFHIDGNGLCYHIINTAYARHVTNTLLHNNNNNNNNPALPFTPCKHVQLGQLTSKHVRQLIHTYCIPTQLIHEVTKEFIETLQNDCRMKLFVYWDGSERYEYKRATDLKRYIQRTEDWNTLYEYCLYATVPTTKNEYLKYSNKKQQSKKKTICAQFLNQFPHLRLYTTQIYHTIHYVLRIPCIQSTNEADEQIAYNVYKNNSSPNSSTKAYVLGLDSDYCFFANILYVPFPTIQVSEVSSKSFVVAAIVLSRESIAESLQLSNPQLMIEIAILMGNDYIGGSTGTSKATTNHCWTNGPSRENSATQRLTAEEIVSFVQDQTNSNDDDDYYYQVTSTCDTVQQIVQYIRQLYNFHFFTSSEHQGIKTTVLDSVHEPIAGNGVGNFSSYSRPATYTYESIIEMAAAEEASEQYSIHLIRPHLSSSILRSLHINFLPSEQTIHESIVRLLNEYYDQNIDNCLITKEHIEAFETLELNKNQTYHDIDEQIASYENPNTDSATTLTNATLCKSSSSSLWRPSWSDIVATYVIDHFIAELIRPSSSTSSSSTTTTTTTTNPWASIIVLQNPPYLVFDPYKYYAQLFALRQKQVQQQNVLVEDDIHNTMPLTTTSVEEVEQGTGESKNKNDVIVSDNDEDSKNDNSDTDTDEIPTVDQFSTAIAEIPRVDEQDMVEFKRQLQIIFAAIEDIQHDRAALEDEIEATLAASAVWNVILAARNKLTELKSDMKALLEQRNVMRSELVAAKKQMCSELVVSKKQINIFSKMKMDKIKAEINKLQQMQKTTSMSRSEKKKLNKEIEKLRASRELAVMTGKIKNIEALILRNTRQIKEVEDNVDQLNQTGCPSALLQKKNELEKKMNLKKAEKRALFRKFNGKALRKQMRAIRKQYEEEKSERDEEMTEYPEQRHMQHMTKVELRNEPSIENHTTIPLPTPSVMVQLQVDPVVGDSNYNDDGIVPENNPTEKTNNNCDTDANTIPIDDPYSNNNAIDDLDDLSKPSPTISKPDKEGGTIADDRNPATTTNSATTAAVETVGTKPRRNNRKDDKAIEDMYDLSKPIPRVEKPDKEALEKELQVKSDAIEALKNARSVVQSKIEATINAASEARSEIQPARKKLIEFKSAKNALIEEKKVLHSKLDVAKNQCNNLLKKKQNAKTNVKFSSISEIEAEISKLQRRQETMSMSHSVKKELIKEIDHLVASKKLVADLKNTDASIDDAKEQKKKITMLVAAKDKEIDEYAKQIKEVMENIDQLNQNESEKKGVAAELFKERDNLRKQMNLKIAEKDALCAKFKEKNDEFYSYQRAVRKQNQMQYEEEKRKRAEDRADYLSKIEAEEAKKIDSDDDDEEEEDDDEDNDDVKEAAIADNNNKNVSGGTFGRDCGKTAKQSSKKAQREANRLLDNAQTIMGKNNERKQQQQQQGLVSTPVSIDQSEPHSTGSSSNNSMTINDPKTDAPIVDTNSIQLPKTITTTISSTTPSRELVLPVDEFENDIIESVYKNRVTIIHGETGCGKSTRVPIMLLQHPPPPLLQPGDDDWLYHGKKKRQHRTKLFISQPRRIAAKGLVERIRSIEPDLKDHVALRMGHGVREYETTSTRAYFVTTGYLVRLLANYPHRFDSFHYIIIDEVHERSVDTDLLCLLCRELLYTNPYIRLVLMSATLATTLYQTYFYNHPKMSPMNDNDPIAPPPIIKVGARRFPVQEVYLSDLLVQNLNADSNSNNNKENLLPIVPPKILQLVSKLSTDIVKNKCKSVPSLEKLYKVTAFLATVIAKPGTSVLIFVTGMNDIYEITELIENNPYNQPNSNKKGTIITCLPIHSDIPIEEQMNVFQKPKHNEIQIIIATNAAESSITLPHVDNVICFGLRKQIQYNPVTHRQILMPTWISQSNAMQRAGRTGRVRCGTVYRLYERITYTHHMKEYESGEMLRMPLDSVILSLKQILPSSSITRTTTTSIDPDHDDDEDSDDDDDNDIEDDNRPTNSNTIRSVLETCLEPPDVSTIERSFQSLYESNFITSPTDDNSICHVTTLGEFVTRIGIDLTLGSLVGLGIQYGVGKEVILLAAVLSCPKSPYLQSNILMHGHTEFNNTTITTFTSRCNYDKGLFSEPFGIMNLMYEYKYSMVPNYEKHKVNAWCYKNGLFLPRLKQLHNAYHALRNRVAQYMNLSSPDTLDVTIPASQMSYSVLTILRILQVWVFHDSIIQYEPKQEQHQQVSSEAVLATTINRNNNNDNKKKKQKGNDSNVDRSNNSSSSAIVFELENNNINDIMIETKHLQQIFTDEQRHPFVLRQPPIKIVHKGAFDTIIQQQEQENSFNVSVFQMRLVSYLTEYRYHIAMVSFDDITVLFVQNSIIQDFVNAVPLLRETNLPKYELKPIVVATCHPSDKKLHGIMERPCGAWNIHYVPVNVNGGEQNEGFWLDDTVFCLQSNNSTNTTCMAQQEEKVVWWNIVFDHAIVKPKLFKPLIDTYCNVNNDVIQGMDIKFHFNYCSNPGASATTSTQSNKKGNKTMKFEFRVTIGSGDVEQQSGSNSNNGISEIDMKDLLLGSASIKCTKNKTVSGKQQILFPVNDTIIPFERTTTSTMSNKETTTKTNTLEVTKNINNKNDLRSCGVDHYSRSSSNRQLLYCIPEAARLLSVLYSSQRRPRCIHLLAMDDNQEENNSNNKSNKKTKKQDNNDSIDVKPTSLQSQPELLSAVEEPNMIELHLKPIQADISTRWKGYNKTGVIVFIEYNSVPGSVVPMPTTTTTTNSYNNNNDKNNNSDNDILYCACSNTLEINGGYLKAEGLTLLPPGKLFLQLCFLTFGLFDEQQPRQQEYDPSIEEKIGIDDGANNIMPNEDDTEVLVEKVMNIVSSSKYRKMKKNKSKDGTDDSISNEQDKGGDGSTTSKDQLQERIRQAIQFNKSATEDGETLHCFPERVKELLSIFNGIDNVGELKVWDDLDVNPFIQPIDKKNNYNNSKRRH